MKTLFSIAMIVFTGSSLALLWDDSPSSRSSPAEAQRGDSNQPDSVRLQTLRLPPWFYDPNAEGHRDERIEISNDTASTIHFKHVGTSCGCAAAELASKDLSPGETTQLHVTIARPSKPGTRSIQVQLKPLQGQPWVYQIDAPMYPVAVVDDFELHLGTLTSGETVSGELTCFMYGSTGDSLARLVSVKTNSPDLATEILSEPPRQHAEGVVRGRSTIRVSLNGQSAAGASSGAIVATFQGGTGTQPFEIAKTIRWRQASLYEVSPSRIFAKNLAQETKPVRATVDIRRHGAETFEILQVKCEKEFVACSVISPAAATEHRLQIEIDPREVGSHFWSTIKVKTNDARQPEILIPIAGFR